MQRLMKRCCQQFCALLGSRRYGYSLRSDTSRQRRDPHSLSATYFRRAVTSMSADLPLGKVPTTRVLRLVSLLSRSIALFVRMRRQCSRGIAQYARVSAYPPRTTLAVPFRLIDSSSSATVMVR